jgi:hypothetical protein
MRKLAGVAALGMILPLRAMAAPLTREQIVELHAAGIGDATIARQVDANGISFDATAAVLLDLKRAGLSDTVLDAVIREGGGRRAPARNPPARTEDSVASLYRSKNYGQAADTVLAKVREGSAGDRDRAVLALALMRLEKFDAAEQQSLSLAARHPTSLYANSIAAAVRSARAMEALRSPLEEANRRLNGREVVRLISASSLSMDDQRELLVDTAVAAGDFERAKELWSTSASSSYADQERLKAGARSLSEQEQAFVDARKAADAFVHAPAAVSSCNPAVPGYGLADAGGAGFTIPAYLDAVAKLVHLAPLNSEALDFAFHAALISSSYQSVEEVGDRILAGVGRTRVLGYASDRYGWLVIDRERQSLSLEPDDHAFAFSRAPASRESLVPFELPFDRLTGLSQSAGGLIRLGAGTLSGKPAPLPFEARALIFKPSGVLPQYALMAFIQCSLGEQAQLNATYNLGAFIQHVAALKPGAVSLVKPDGDHGGRGLDPVLAGIRAVLGVNRSAPRTEATRSPTESQIGNPRWADVLSPPRMTLSVWNSPAIRALEAKLGVAEAALGPNLRGGDWRPQ